MTDNDTHLNRFLDLVVKQTEKLEESFKEFKKEVAAKIDSLAQRTSKLEGRVGSLEMKVEEVLKKVSLNGSGSQSVVNASKYLEERVQKLETGGRSPVIIWGKQFYFPSWLSYVLVVILSIIVGAAIATGNVTALLDFLKGIIK